MLWHRTHRFLPLAVWLVVGHLASLVSGQTTSWIGANGDWFDSVNWSNGVPGSTDEAIVGNGGTALSNMPSVNPIPIGNLRVGDGPGLSGGVGFAGVNVVIGNDLIVGSNMNLSGQSGMQVLGRLTVQNNLLLGVNGFGLLEMWNDLTVNGSRISVGTSQSNTDSIGALFVNGSPTGVTALGVDFDAAVSTGGSGDVRATVRVFDRIDLGAGRFRAAIGGDGNAQADLTLGVRSSAPEFIIGAATGNGAVFVSSNIVGIIRDGGSVDIGIATDTSTSQSSVYFTGSVGAIEGVTGRLALGHSMGLGNVMVDVFTSTLVRADAEILIGVAESGGNASAGLGADVQPGAIPAVSVGVSRGSGNATGSLSSPNLITTEPNSTLVIGGSFASGSGAGSATFGEINGFREISVGISATDGDADGSLFVSSPSQTGALTVGVAQGTGSATGRIDVDVDAVLVVTSEMRLGDGSTLSFVISGTTPGAGHGIIEADTATLDGDLSAGFIAGYVPGAGDYFDLITLGPNQSFVGAFDALYLPSLPIGLAIYDEIVRGPLNNEIFRISVVGVPEPHYSVLFSVAVAIVTGFRCRRSATAA